MSEKKYVIKANCNSERIDKFITNEIKSLSRSKVQFYIKNQFVTHNNIIIRNPALKIIDGDEVVLKIRDNDNDRKKRLIDYKIEIVFQDDNIIVVDKPSGIVTHSSYEGQVSLVNILLEKNAIDLSESGEKHRRGVVHRLDKDTSGLMVLTKTNKAYEILKDDFKKRNILKVYNAVTWGVPVPKIGIIDKKIGKAKGIWNKMSILDSGKHSITNYKLVKSFFNTASLVECRIFTGRTHQIRVHLFSIGCPIIGDKLYSKGRNISNKVKKTIGSAIDSFSRQALHSKILGFSHPITKSRLLFKSKMPYDIKELLKILS